MKEKRCWEIANWQRLNGNRLGEARTEEVLLAQRRAARAAAVVVAENSNGHVFANNTGHKDRPWCRLNGKCFTTMTRMIRWSCQQWLEIQRDIVRKSWRKRRLNGNNWRQAEKSGYDAVDVSCEKLLRDSQTGASYQHRTHWPRLDCPVSSRLTSETQSKGQPNLLGRVSGVWA